MKIGPFAEHSNQLWNVSAVSTWSKVNSGLIKMYKAEVIMIVEYFVNNNNLLFFTSLFQVLAKFPVIQHVFFGSLLPLTPMNNPSTNSRTRLNEPPAALK